MPVQRVQVLAIRSGAGAADRRCVTRWKKPAPHACCLKRSPDRFAGLARVITELGIARRSRMAVRFGVLVLGASR